MNNKHLAVGVSGESIICRYLRDQGHSILHRNLRYKCGEIDIVTTNKGILHFIEVKTANLVSCETQLSVNPEENLTNRKMLRIRRSIQMYFLQNKVIQEDCDWQFDLYTVVIRETEKKANIYKYENLIL